jgi:hypothetical protein
MFTIRLQGLTRPACPVCPLPHALGGIWAGAADAVFTAGWTHAFPGNEALLSGDGSAWTPVLEPDAGWNVIPHAHRVYAADATHAWALTEGTIWAWDGAEWTAVLLVGDGGGAAESSFMALSGHSSSDVYLATAGSSSVNVRHWAGSAWSAAAAVSTSPYAGGRPWCVSHLAGGAVWAGGEGYTRSGGGYDNGVVYALSPSPAVLWEGAHSGGSYQIPLGISMEASSNVWICGALADTGAGSAWDYAYSAGFLRRWNGSSWVTPTGPTIPAGSEYIYRDVYARTSSDVWVVGAVQDSSTHAVTGLLALQWTGSAWVTHALPGGYAPGTYGRLSGVHARTSTDVWVAGEVCSESGTRAAYVAHWDGSTWTDHSPPGDVWTPRTFVFPVLDGRGVCHEYYQAALTYDLCAAHTVSGAYTIWLDEDTDGVYETLDFTSAPFSVSVGPGIGSYLEPTPQGPGSADLAVVGIIPYQARFTLTVDGGTPFALAWVDILNVCE